MRKLFYFFILALAVSCSSHSNLRVISFNIRTGSANDGSNCWDNRKSASIAMVKAENPDVFGVQEAYDFQLRYFTENLPDYSCVGVGREDGKSAGEHMSIFYRTADYSLLDWGTYWLSETPDEPSMGWDAACKRTATWTRFRQNKTGKEFFYVNTHLDHVGWEARRKGLALIVERIAAMNPGGVPMVLAGDFNVTPDNACLADLRKVMKNARETATSTTTAGSFNGWGETREVIDYIWYQGFASCTDFVVLDRPYGNIPYISDHYPVRADLVF